jgi:hypothetical protein
VCDCEFAWWCCDDDDEGKRKMHVTLWRLSERGRGRETDIVLVYVSLCVCLPDRVVMMWWWWYDDDGKRKMHVTLWSRSGPCLRFQQDDLQITNRYFMSYKRC